MDNKDLDHFHHLLVDLRRSISEVSETLSEAGKTVELDQTRVGRLSRMDAMQGQQMALASQRRQQQKLVAIESALRRIESGNYGMCFECDEPINPLRLKADPTHTRCIKCAD